MLSKTKTVAPAIGSSPCETFCTIPHCVAVQMRPQTAAVRPREMLLNSSAIGLPSTKRHNSTKNSRQSAAVAVRGTMPDVSNWLKACFSKHGHLTKATKHKKNTSPKWYRPAGSAPWMEVGGDLHSKSKHSAGASATRSLAGITATPHGPQRATCERCKPCRPCIAR